MSKIKNSRRETTPVADAELYSLPKASIKEFIKKERRHDELGRLREVQEQKKVWLNTMIFCGVLNLALVGLAIIGMWK